VRSPCTSQACHRAAGSARACTRSCAGVRATGTRRLGSAAARRIRRRCRCRYRTTSRGFGRRGRPARSAQLACRFQALRSATPTTIRRFETGIPRFLCQSFPV
jgi:hypothetical protein